MDKQEQAVIRQYNTRVAQENKPPREIPDQPAEMTIEQIVAEASQLADALEAHYAALWMLLRKQGSSSKYVQFSNGTRWSTNAFLVPEGGRADLVLDRALTGLRVSITSWSE